MNSDEVKSLLTILVTLVCAALATHGVTVSTEDKLQMVTDLSIAIPSAISFAGIVVHIVQHWNMKRVPEQSIAVQLPGGPQSAPLVGSSIPIGGTTGKIVGAILLGLLILPTQSRAAISETDILTKIVSDAQGASRDAAQNNDTIAKTCYDAIVLAAQTKLAAGPGGTGGVLTTFQKLRDLTRLNSSPVGTSLIVNCAGLAQDARLTIVDLFAKLGASVLIKGVVVP